MLGVIGGLLIISGCTLYGVSYSTRLKRRIDILKNFINIFERMTGFIEYSILDMQAIFTKLSRYEYSPAVENFIKITLYELNKSDMDTFGVIWSNTIEQSFSGILKDDEIMILNDVGKLSDYYDKENQINIIMSVKEECKGALEILKDGARNKMKAYIAAGISAGLILVITLI